MPLQGENNNVPISTMLRIKTLTGPDFALRRSYEEKKQVKEKS